VPGWHQFTSTDFNYTVESKRKEWEITIKLREPIDVRELILRFFKNGSASLMVSRTTGKLFLTME
jgi:hypothetical protein